jgi:beta-aspartyl-peptidase (threonine type)
MTTSVNKVGIKLIANGGAGDIQNLEPYRTGIKIALEAGYKILAEGASALAAAVETVRMMEDLPIFNAGTGSVLTIAGTVEMDASVMTDDGGFGAVGAINDVKNPILVARKVMEETDHLLLVGDGALKFARLMGFGPHNPITEDRIKRLNELKEKKNAPYHPKFEKYLDAYSSANGEDFGAAKGFAKGVPFGDAHGTVGAVAFDSESHLAVTNSTGGIMGKLPGRVGDSAILGAGTYVSKSGGVATTGHGESITRLSLAKTTVELMKNFSAGEAVARALKIADENGCRSGLIGIDASGTLGYGFNTKTMAYGFIDGDKLTIF